MFDGVGDDALIETVRGHFQAVNGEHPMSEADDAYVREHFTPATPQQLVEIAAGRLPLPGYLLRDGTPMVADIEESLAAAGGIDRLRGWFLAFWPTDPETGGQEWDRFLSGRYVCLRQVDPAAIRTRTRLLDQAETAVAALRADRSDQIAQGSLAEAIDGGLGVDGLATILLPMTRYDRLRFGGPTVHDVWLVAARAEFHDPQPPRLPIHTERLTLRRTLPEDAEARAAAMAEPDFVRYLLTPEQNLAETSFLIHRRTQPDPAGQHRALGLMMIHDGEVIGDVVLFLQGAGLTSAEIGWTIHPAAAGQGLATEAAEAMLKLAFEHYRVRRVVAELDADNERSAAMAERLGMRREAHRVADFWSKGQWTSSYDYAILRDEWQARRAPEADA